MQNTGLFFFRGNPGEKFAVLNAGGGFMYVAGMQDSIPHALELSKKGYNAFALIYRPETQTACEDFSHGFGLGEGTVAEGWLDHAVEFWENNME